jgi:hypothetical protein
MYRYGKRERHIYLRLPKSAAGKEGKDKCESNNNRAPLTP